MIYRLIFFTIFSLLVVENALAYEEVTIRTDKKIYFLHDTIIFSGKISTIPHDNDVVLIEITNPHSNIIKQIEVGIDEKSGNFMQPVSLIENVWNVEGLYLVKVYYEDLENLTYFQLSRSESQIVEQLPSKVELLEPTYSWTETIEIFVFAPSFNRNYGTDFIGRGSNAEGTIEIKTTLGRLENYRLVETDIDSGIFHGTVTLTGDTSNGSLGETGGHGPFNGRLASLKHDAIFVTFSNSNETIEVSAKIRWMEGKFEVDESKLEPSGDLIIRLIDKDMNLDYQTQEFLEFKIMTTGYNRLLKAHETGKSTGIFETVIEIPAYEKWRKAKKTDSFIDSILLLYNDTTHPLIKPKYEFVEVSSKLTIGDPSKPHITMPKPDLEFFIAESKPIFEQKFVFPNWIKNYAERWSKGTMGNNEFVSVIKYLDEKQVVHLPEKPEKAYTDSSQHIPGWMKNNARWWNQELISDDEFISGIQYLVDKKIIKIK